MNLKKHLLIERSISKNFQPFFLTIFFIVLLFVPIFTLLKGESTPEENVIEARAIVALRPSGTPNLQRALNHLEKGEVFQAVELLMDLFTAASFMEKAERATSDQFPLRMPIIQFSKAVERGIINTAYGLLPDRAIPADMSHNIYIDKDRNQLINMPTFFNENTRSLIDQRIENYETLIEQHPNLNFYVYYHQTLRDTPYSPLTPYFADADQSQSIEYFEKNLPDGLILEKFMLTGMDDHMRYYFRTDHHWNVHGVLRAYEEIHNMLSQKYPDISPVLKIEEIVDFPEIEFLGNLARLTFYPIEGDEFAVEVVDFPPYTLIYGGQEITENPRSLYFKGNYSTIPYINHFNEFYGRVTDLSAYTVENDSERNLLIIGSSYRYALDPLLASHYKNTYCIDLRYFTTFSLSEFLLDHKVDDILLVGNNQVLFQDLEHWIINP
jgi:hypothetical protein